MHLSLDALTVESFATTFQKIEAPSTGPYATGPMDPPSYCYICRPTDPTVPSCDVACDA